MQCGWKVPVCVKKDKVIVGHLPLGETGKSAKLIFYFFRADSYANCNIVIAEREVNIGNGEWMQVLCLLKTVGKNKC